MYIQFYKTFPGIDLSKYYFEQEDYKFIGPIKNLNIFIGPNNSGKSRFMREIMKIFQTFSVNDKNFYIENINSKKLLNKLINRYTFNSNAPQINVRPGYVDTSNDKVITEYAQKISLYTQGYQRTFSLDFFKGIVNSLELIYEKFDDSGMMKSILKGISDSNNDIKFLWFLKTNFNQYKNYHSQKYNLNYSNSISEEFLKELSEIYETLDKFLIASNNKIDNIQTRIYIPVLRTSYNLFRGDSKSSEDLFSSTVLANYPLKLSEPKNYNGEKFSQVQVFTGNEMYNIVDTLSNSARGGRQKIRDFESFLSKTFFDNSNIHLIPFKPSLSQYSDQTEEYDTETLLLNVENIEHEIHNYGDGINNVIILMFKLFTAEDNSWIFIEEPEISLHPAYQRIFVETILTNSTLLKKNLKIFITTHSNHILDLSLENFENVSLFTFERNIDRHEDESYRIQTVGKGDLRILNLLGINNSSIFLANCSIWVEGITDRKYLKSYLNAYMESEEFLNKNNKRYLEDVHYCFFEYAGSNLKHYIFKRTEQGNNEDELINEQIKAQFLSNKIFLLADKDKAKEEKHFKLFEQENIGFKYQVTKGWEIENLISADLLKLSLPKLSQEISIDEAKNLTFIYRNYWNKPLGNFLDEIFADKRINFSSKSGTLKDYYKQRLPDIIAPFVTWENITPTARELTKEIYEFIKSHNN